MLVLLSLAVVYGGWRVVRLAFDAVQRLPRCNDDMVFF
jgi:hypothetical protein